MDVVIGLDIATKLGWCILPVEGDDSEAEYGVFGFVKEGDRIRRWDKYVTSIKGLLACKDVKLIALEGYSFGSHSGVILIAELGGIVRYELRREYPKIPQFEISPSALKKFATGKGNVPKDVVIKEVYKRWKFDTNDNNIADAFVLAKMGQCLAKGENIGLPQFQHDTLVKVIEDPHNMAQPVRTLIS